MRKAISLIIVLTVAIAGLVACGKSQKKTNMTRARDSRNGNYGYQPGNLSTAEFPIDGQVQNFTTAAIQDFVSPMMQPEHLGMVSPNFGDSTGVWFGGQVQLTSGRINQGSFGSVSGAVASNSRILIEIIDSYTFQVDDTGQTIDPIDIYLPRASGQISGNQATVTFSDGYGSVTLSGSFTNQGGRVYFDGTMSYSNSLSYSGGAQNSGNRTLGHFMIPACSFFVCQ